MNRRLPVVLVGGFLGAGKTSLLHHFISEHQGGHLAVLVDNPGTLNLDAKAMAGLCGAMRRTHDTVLAIPAGEEEAQLEWIAARLEEFEVAGRHERVLIEVSGTTNPARWARAEILKPWCEGMQVVCVVDAFDLHLAMHRPGSPGLFAFQRALSESASLLVLNKCDLIGDAERMACTRALRQGNPKVKVVETAYGEMPADILTTPGNLPAPTLEAETGPELPTLGSILYRAYRPFHPQRFWNWFNEDHPQLWRVKGVIWLATRNLLVGGVSRTRWENACGTAGIWWAALPREEWPEDVETLRKMQETWREPYGDRRQELVLIGESAVLASLARGLDACLLTAEEYAQPVGEWTTFADPFPEWDLAEG